MGISAKYKDLINSIDKLVEDGLKVGKRPKYSKIVEELNLSRMFLVKNIEINQYIADKEHQYKMIQLKKKNLEYDEALINKAVDRLIEKDIKITYTNVAKEMGIIPKYLYRNKFVKDAKIMCKARKHMKDKDALREKIIGVMDSMIAEEKRITNSSVMNAVGLKTHYVYSDSYIYSTISSYKRKQSEEMMNRYGFKTAYSIEDKKVMYERLSKAIRELEDSGEVISVISVAKRAGIEKSIVYNYPKIIELINEKKVIQVNKKIEQISCVLERYKMMYQEANTARIMKETGINYVFIRDNEQARKLVEAHNEWLESYFAEKITTACRRIDKLSGVTLKVVAEEAGIPVYEILKRKNLLELIRSIKNSEAEAQVCEKIENIKVALEDLKRTSEEANISKIMNKTGLRYVFFRDNEQALFLIEAHNKEIEKNHLQRISTACHKLKKLGYVSVNKVSMETGIPAKAIRNKQIFMQMIHSMNIKK